MKDARDQEIRMGDTVAYVTRRGSHMEMVFGKVIETADNAIRVVRNKHPWRDTKRPVRLATPEYIVIIKQLEGQNG